MSRLACAVVIFVLAALTSCFGQEQGLLIDDFEDVISGGPEGTVDFGSGGGSSNEVTASGQIKQSASQSLKVVYNAVPGGYLWVARGQGLDAKNSAWLVRPKDIDWAKYNAFSFYTYGSGSKARIAFDVKDSGSEMWRFTFEDNFKGWKQITCLFGEFLPRDDWQPDAADKNAKLDFPLQSFQFEPLPEASGTLYFDAVELVKNNTGK